MNQPSISTEVRESARVTARALIEDERQRLHKLNRDLEALGIGGVRMYVTGAVTNLADAAEFVR